MLCCLEVLPLQASDACLFDLRVHLFELVDCELLDMVLDDLDALMVVGKVWAMSFQADHVECFGGFQGTMKVEVFPGVLGFVQIG
jgi:hypothetical protein